MGSTERGTDTLGGFLNGGVLRALVISEAGSYHQSFVSSLRNLDAGRGGSWGGGSG